MSLGQPSTTTHMVHGPRHFGSSGGSASVTPAPTISSISPSSGDPAGGTAVTITGTNFTSDATVTIGASATNVVFVSATKITCTTAAHAAGAVNVVVSQASGTATLANGFTYTASGAQGESWDFHDGTLGVFQTSTNNAGAVSVVANPYGSGNVALCEIATGTSGWAAVIRKLGLTTISADINASQTTIPVVSTVTFITAANSRGSVGTITIGSEQITYTGQDATNFTGCARGANGTTAASHTSGANVLQNPMLVSATGLYFRFQVYVDQPTIDASQGSPHQSKLHTCRVNFSQPPAAWGMFGFSDNAFSSTPGNEVNLAQDNGANLVGHSGTTIAAGVKREFQVWMQDADGTGSFKWWIDGTLINTITNNSGWGSHSFTDGNWQPVAGTPTCQMASGNDMKYWVAGIAWNTQFMSGAF